MHRAFAAATLSAVLLLAAPAAADPPAEQAAPSPEAPAEAPGRWLVFLRDGRTLRGEVVDRDGTSLTLLLTRTGKPERIDESQVRRVDGPPLPPRCAAGDDRELVLVLLDGRTVEGRLVRRCEAHADLATDGGVVRVADAEVSRGGRRGEPPGPGASALPIPPGPPEPDWRLDPAASRDLASPTALMPRGGELTIMTRLASVGVQYGLLGLAELGAESTLPVLYAEPLTANLQLRASAGAGYRLLSGRAGAVASIHAGGLSTVHLFGAVTLGDAERHLSLYAGPSLPGGALAGGFEDLGYSASGAWRINRRLGAVTEHWLGDTPQGRRTMHALALRAYAGPAVLDLGAVFIPHVERVYPWFGFTWQVGSGRAP